MTPPRHPAASPTPRHRYLWWPLLLSTAWLVAVAVGLPWPAVLLMLPCVVTAVMVAKRGPFPYGWLAPTLRMAAAVVPMIVVNVLNPRYDRFGINQGQPGVITPAEFWAYVARAELIALVVIEAGLLALARGRSDA